MKLSSYSMAATIDQLPILSMFVNMIRAKLVVEIGTFTGISALQFALVNFNSSCGCVRLL